MLYAHGRDQQQKVKDVFHVDDRFLDRQIRPRDSLLIGLSHLKQVRSAFQCCWQIDRSRFPPFEAC